jgi:hypothetical protein
MAQQEAYLRKEIKGYKPKKYLDIRISFFIRRKQNVRLDKTTVLLTLKWPKPIVKFVY